jgi:propanediol dehydratase small subunit
MNEKLSTADYPLAEKRPELIRGHGGKALGEITLDRLVAGEVTLDDLRITPAALKLQAEIAGAANRPRLAANFERAAELVDVPQDFLMEVYELLRPGRARSKAPLVEAAAKLRDTYGATRMAAFVEEAAEVYERRGLFTYRF